VTVDPRAPSIYVARRQYGDFVARIPALAGCAGAGATRDDAIANAREAYRVYHAALRRRSHALGVVSGLDPEALPVIDESGAGFFDEDAVPLGSDEFRALASLFAGLTEEIARLVAPCASALSETRVGDEWSVREIMDHLAETQLRWLSRLDALADGSFRVHAAIHAMVHDRIAAAGATPFIDRSVLGDRWTARRVVRRLIEHQMEHVDQIRATLLALDRAEPPQGDGEV
jgi:predicted RNase H-like HicB family nuclease